MKFNDLKNNIIYEIDLFLDSNNLSKYKQKYIVRYNLESSKFGDYSINLGLIVKDDKTIRKVVNHLEKIDFIKKIEVVAGFINIFLCDQVYIETINSYSKISQILSDLKVKKSIKINCEFVSANPTGPLSVGNARGGYQGNALANILEIVGHKVNREYYVNDFGNQIKELKKSIFGDSDQYQGKYLTDIRKDIQGTNIDIVDLSDYILNKYIKPSLKINNIKFDIWFKESSLYPDKVKAAIDVLKKDDLVYEKNQATWVRTKKLGDEKDRVIIKKNGEYTYFASDIAYLKDKIDRGYEKIIFYWGADHHGYIGRIKAIANAFNFPEKNIIINLFQLVKIIENGHTFKISKRLGKIITLDQFSEIVKSDVAKYIILGYDQNKEIVFDILKAKEKSGKNPVYYAQYGMVRYKKIRIKILSKDQQLLDCIGENEKSIARVLIGFKETIHSIENTYRITELVKYLHYFTKEVHTYYEKEQVVGSKDESQKLTLVNAVINIYETAFKLLGVSNPDEM